MKPRIIVGACLALALLGAGAAHAGDREDGEAARTKGDFKTALKLLVPLAHQGDIGAEIDVGTMYFAGQGVPKDHLEAAKWFLAAAEQGNVGGESDIGIEFAAGAGVQKNYIQAYMWFSLAVSQGGKSTQPYLDHVASEMMPEQIQRAQDLARRCKASNYKACDSHPMPEVTYPPTGLSGDAAAAFRKGDYATALRLDRQLAEDGNDLAQSDLGLMYAYGAGVTQDYGQAREWFSKAADQGDQQAQNELGKLYEKGLGVPADCQTAMGWYDKAAKHGYAVAQFTLFNMYWAGSCGPIDRPQAFKWISAAAGAGMAEAQYNLGLMYERGFGAPQDDARAYYWFTVANKRIQPGDSGFAENRAMFENHLAAMAKNMTAAQIAEMQRQAAAWTPHDTIE